MTTFINPETLFFDLQGLPLSGGKIYLGTAGLDPQVLANQLALTFPGPVPASQPLQVTGGRIVNGSNPAPVTLPTGLTSYAVRILDVNNQIVYSNLNVVLSDTAYQPLDADLTALAAVATQGYGRNLTGLSNQAALQAAVGLPAALPLTGGTVTNDITRSTLGTYLYSHTGTAGKVMILPTSDTTTSTTGAYLVMRY